MKYFIENLIYFFMINLGETHWLSEVHGQFIKDGHIYFGQLRFY